MERHVVLELINDYGLDRSLDLADRLAAISPQEWHEILSRIILWYDSHEESIVTSFDSSDPFTIYLPTATSDSLHLSTGYLPLVNKALLDDTLANHVEMLDMALNDFSLEEEIDTNLLTEENQQAVLSFFRMYKEIITSHCRRQIVETLQFYIDARDLIAEGIVTPLSRSRNTKILNSFRTEWEERVGAELQSVARYDGLPLDLLRNRLAEIFTPIVDFAGMAAPAYDFLMYGWPRVRSIDVLSQKTQAVFRSIAEALRPDHTSGNRMQGMTLCSFSLETLPCYGLTHVPLPEVCDLRRKLGDSVGALRASLTVELDSVPANVDGNELDTAIVAIRHKLAKDLQELGTNVKAVRREYARRLGTDVGMLLLSLGIGVLAASPSNLGTLAVAEAVGAGGILTAGLKSLVQDWLGLKKELDKIERNSAYCLWKMRSTERL